jgi:hypothetical protein
VEKGTSEFKATQKRYLELFAESKDSDFIRMGIFEYGENKGKCLGLTSKKIQAANLSMPFGCPDLFIQPTDGGVIWFCNRTGYICVCCREDFTGENEKYPDYCPSPEGFEPEPCDCGSSTCDECNPGWDEESLEEEEDYPDW